MAKAFLLRPKKAVKRPNVTLISATPNTSKIAKSIWSKDSHVVCEVGSRNKQKTDIKKQREGQPLKIVWSGLHISRKNLPLLLRSLAKV